MEDGIEVGVILDLGVGIGDGSECSAFELDEGIVGPDVGILVGTDVGA
jgi:hypothetical protein